MATSSSTLNSAPPPQGPRFPARVALAMLCAVAVLVAAHFYRDGSKGFDPTLFRSTARLHWPKAPAPVSPGMPLNGVQQTPLQHPAVVPGAPPPISPVLTDDSLALDPFFAALWKLEQTNAAADAAFALPTRTQHLASEFADVVTILHYGDSPTTADLITGDARAQLQTRFGDAGAGFNLAAKPWAWYGHRHVEIDDSGWASSQRDATGVGRLKGGTYGLGGAVFTGGPGARTTYKLTGAEQTEADVQFLAGPTGGTFTVAPGKAEATTINTRADTQTAAAKSVLLPTGTKQVTLTVTSGTVTMFGVDFRRGTRGVVYSSLGLNGATTTVISHTFDPTLWAEELKHTAPALIVINYGTNESQFGGLVQTLDKELRAAIDRTRAAAPGVPILIMSPMDRGERAGMSEIHTMAAIPEIVGIQQKVAAETHCGFFNTYAAMGGDGTMSRWYTAKPRLVTADFIHPTPQGAQLVAGLLVDNLYAGYDRWKRAHNVAVTPQPVPPAPAPKPAAKPSTAKPAVAHRHTARTGAATP